MRKVHDAGVFLGAAALAGAVVLFATVFARAILSAPAAPLPAPTATPAPGSEAAIEETRTGEPATVEREREAGSETPRGSEIPDEVLRLAAERAPFAPDRRAPDDRYRMPGERVAAAEPPPAPPELPPAPDFRVLGTVAGPDGGVAVIQVEGERPHVMAMGEELFGYRVASIGSGNVVLEGQGRSLNLGVAGPIPTGATETADARGQRGQQRGGQNPQQEVMAAARERAMEMARQMQAQGGGQVRVQMLDGRIVIQGPGGETREIRIPTGGDGQQIMWGGFMRQGQQGQQQRRPPQQQGGGGGG